MQNRIFWFLVFALIMSPWVKASSQGDEHIRQIVSDMLREKDQKIEQLEARIRQLEQEKQSAPPLAKQGSQTNQVATTATPSQPVAPATTPSAGTSDADASVTGKLRELTKQVDKLKTSAEENGLVISGFFDVNAKTSNSTDQTFSVGSVELDLDYVHGEHFGASTALVLCGNSPNVELNGPAHIICGNSGPGGLSGEKTSAGIAVALVDYHLFNDRIPPRGRIFNNQGLHIQAGRFDLPFGSDYQYFANKDRITITAPLTTSRMQLGGYNSDGVRSYGSWNNFNYSAFWTNAIYDNDGYVLGGRLGMALGQNTYTVHQQNLEGIELGVSHLSEWGRHSNIRNTVYGADLSINYGMWRLQNEFMLIQGHQDVILDSDGDGVPDVLVGKGHQFGYHSTLVADLERFIKQPLRAFVRYSSWQPSQQLEEDFDGNMVALNDISMLSLGLNYKFNEHLRIKLEYNDSLGTWIAERFFDKRLGIAQIVMSF